MAAVSLAERRKREKWCDDPRNTKWSNDTTRFGYRMLEKMGWCKGKGLGMNEDGALEHTKVMVKKDSCGLGAKRGRDDDWVEHQVEFDQILAQLGKEHDGLQRGTSDAEVKSTGHCAGRSKVKTTFSVKSTSNPKRLKYTKVLKSKDLSSKRIEDLNCVFGKRKRTRSPKHTRT